MHFIRTRYSIFNSYNIYIYLFWIFFFIHLPLLQPLLIAPDSVSGQQPLGRSNVSSGSVMKPLQSSWMSTSWVFITSRRGTICLRLRRQCVGGLFLSGGMGQGQRGLDLVQLFHLGKPHQIWKFLHSIKMNPSALPDVTSINFLTCFTVLVLFSKCALASNKTNTYSKIYIKPHVSSMKFRVFNFLPHQDSKCVGAEVPGVPWREAHITSGFFEGRNWGHWGPQSLQRWWWFCQGVQCPCHSPCWSHLGFARLARRTASQLQEAFSRLAASPPCRLQVQPHVLELNPECFHPFAFKFWCPVCSENCHRFNNWIIRSRIFQLPV